MSPCAVCMDVIPGPGGIDVDYMSSAVVVIIMGILMSHINVLSPRLTVSRIQRVYVVFVFVGHTP